eukprot:scaffold21327_cov82-Skeletonema_marinoi.AAC.1
MSGDDTVVARFHVARCYNLKLHDWVPDSVIARWVSPARYRATTVSPRNYGRSVESVDCCLLSTQLEIEVLQLLHSIHFALTLIYPVAT